MTAFRNRAEAGRALAERLGHLRGADAVVLALPRGGVPVAFEVATALAAPLDLLLVRKLGAPGLAELAIGAVVGGPEPATVLNEGIIGELGVPAEYIDGAVARGLAEIARQRELYLSARPPIRLAGRTVVVVDDGVATGATMRAALEALAKSGAGHVVAALPVAPPLVAADLARACGEVVALVQPQRFAAVGQCYDDFSQTPDDEVVALLAAAAEAGRRVIGP